MTDYRDHRTVTDLPGMVTDLPAEFTTIRLICSCCGALASPNGYGYSGQTADWLCLICMRWAWGIIGERAGRWYRLEVRWQYWEVWA